MSGEYFIGVDVGTGSARAGLFTTDGKMLKISVQNIQTWNPKSDFYEQSSDDIWRACVKCIKSVSAEIPSPEVIKGLGFTATCSLVALDKSDKPLSVSPTGNPQQNIILWMDHRASAEAEKINSLQSSVLKYVGGKISLEMETPKLLWLKKNLPQEWQEAGKFFDLPDFLTFKATGSDSRSLCSLVCKWTYVSSENHEESSWNSGFFRDAGLGDLEEDDWAKIGRLVLPPGAPVGRGLSEESARELGLKVGTPVGASIIDAHAGGLALMGCQALSVNPEFSTRVALICGTSTCHMAVSRAPIFVKGVWGPYFSAMVPGFWVNEGGQSVTGKLLDHIIESHPATTGIKKKIGLSSSIHFYLSRLLSDLATNQKLDSVCLLAKDLHVWPDFHGNRSPLADNSLRGMISGLTLAETEENLALLYLATVQALGYGTRHILDSLKGAGYPNFQSVLICGGLAKNPLFTQTQADILNFPVVVPEEPESVLLGAAILGASGASYFPDVSTAIRSMGGKGAVVAPNQNNSVRDYHSRKYKVFLKMYEDQLSYRNMMQDI